MDSNYEWRHSHIVAGLDLGLFDQREWRNTLGLRYSAWSWLDLAYSFSYDKLLSGLEGVNAVENNSIHHQEFTLYFQSPYFEPYVSYTTGVYRVRPGEPITKSDSFNVGIAFKF